MCNLVFCFHILFLFYTLSQQITILFYMKKDNKIKCITQPCSQQKIPNAIISFQPSALSNRILQFSHNRNKSNRSEQSIHRKIYVNRSRKLPENFFSIHKQQIFTDRKKYDFNKQAQKFQTPTFKQYIKDHKQNDLPPYLIKLIQKMSERIKKVEQKQEKSRLIDEFRSIEVKRNQQQPKSKLHKFSPQSQTIPVLTGRFYKKARTKALPPLWDLIDNK